MFITFSVYVVIGGVLTPTRVFVTFTLYNLMSATCVYSFSCLVQEMAGAKVALERIKVSFLLAIFVPVTIFFC